MNEKVDRPIRPKAWLLRSASRARGSLVVAMTDPAPAPEKVEVGCSCCGMPMLVHPWYADHAHGMRILCDYCASDKNWKEEA